MLADIAQKITGYHYKDIHKAFESILNGMNSISIQENCEYLESTINQTLSNAVADTTTKKTPELLVIAGIPYSGKSTHIKTQLAQYTSCTISFDEIMNAMPLYQHLMLETDAKTAFHNTELVARIAGYELLGRAIHQGLDVIFEHSSALQEHVNLYRTIKEAFAYKVQMRVLRTSQKQAYQRAASDPLRDSGRHTPNSYIDSRHQALLSLLPEYESIMPIHYIDSE